MYQLVKINEATAVRRNMYFQLIATDGVSPVTGATGLGRISINGTATQASINSIFEIDSVNMPGRYFYQLAAGEVTTLGFVEFRYKSGPSLEVHACAQIVGFDPYDSTGLGLSNVDANVGSRAKPGDAMSLTVPERG